jgi:Rieske Fe-S protein
VAKSTTCLWCGEGITLFCGEWIHAFEDGPDSYIFCRCHCAKCDPENGLDQGNACIDGEPATPDLMTIKEEHCA